METKRCTSCNEFKLFEDFSAGNDQNKLNYWCKECYGNYKKIRRGDLAGKQKIDKYGKEARKKYLTQWKEIALELYGDFKCEICECNLDWYVLGSGKNKNVITFDHRNGDEVLDNKRSVMGWMCDRPLSEKNIAMFKVCDFGMVCGPCNRDLGRPKGRKERWIKQGEYINRGPI